MTIETIGPDAGTLLRWTDLADAIAAGHRLPRARIADTYLHRRHETLLSRSAWIDGLGLLVKTCTIFPDNPARDLPTVNGIVTLFDDTDGRPTAQLDFPLVNAWKTAGDSLLAARTLARPESRAITLVGAGTVARTMIDAYTSAFPDARFTVWNRTPARADALAGPRVTLTDDLEASIRNADIVCTATMSREPLVRGAWLRPGTHLDLIGAYLPDMREVDDDALRRATLFVDSRATTIDHVGELCDPIARGVITRSDVHGDFYDLADGTYARTSADEITIAKNGGGAHLDLLTADYITRVVRGSRA